MPTSQLIPTSLRITITNETRNYEQFYESYSIWVKFKSLSVDPTRILHQKLNWAQILMMILCTLGRHSHRGKREKYLWYAKVPFWKTDKKALKKEAEEDKKKQIAERMKKRKDRKKEKEKKKVERERSIWWRKIKVADEDVGEDVVKGKDVDEGMLPQEVRLEVPVVVNQAIEEVGGVLPQLVPKAKL